MNFLAHIYLSGKNDEIIIGNFIGDFVKGNQFESFEDSIRQGIQLHREIDQYTDNHPVVLESKKRLWEKYHHYSPVIVDVYYDHFLSKYWSNYHQTPLKDFTGETYQMLEQNLTKIPERAKRMLTYMKQGDWLYNYQYIEGIRQALTGMSRRTSFKSRLELAHGDLEKNYESFKEEFELFFPQLIQHSKDFLATLSA
ncbi:MAG: ACP phosphodiesterase [Bacteroidota bacterium]